MGCSHILRTIGARLLRLSASRMVHVVAIAPRNMESPIVIKVHSVDVSDRLALPVTYQDLISRIVLHAL